MRFLNPTYAILTAITLLSLHCAQQKEPTKPSAIDLVIGTFTGSGSRGIYQASFNTLTGALTDTKLLAETSNPSYLVISPDRNLIFSVNEDDSGKVSSFAWDQEADKLNLISQVSCSGSSPCYIDLQENRVAVANYMTGNLVFYTTQAGKLSENYHVRQHEGAGPNQKRQEGPHAHCSIFSKDGKFVYAVDLGIDKIMGYAINEDGSLSEGHLALELAGGDGPRHLIFHPEKNLAFVVNELSNSVLSLGVNPELGTFDPISRVSTLPGDFTEHSQCADIHLTPDGRFLYVSNRGHNSIAIFSVSPEGDLSFLGTESTKGNWPRNFTLSPDGQFLLVANQNSNSIIVFRIDPSTGLLEDTGNMLEIPKPACLKF